MTGLIARDEYSALLGRLQHLENENRKMKRVGALVLVATAALIFMGQTGKNRALDADSLVIRDASGNARIELGTSDDQSPVLRMFDGSNNKSASAVLYSDLGGSALSFFGKKGLMVLGNKDSPTLILADGTGGTSIGVASVDTYDNDKFHAFLGRTQTVDTKTGSTTQTTAGSITLIGKDGKAVWQAP